MAHKTTKSKRARGAVRGSIRGAGAGTGAGLSGVFHETHQAINHVGTAGLYAGITPIAAGLGAYKGAQKGWNKPGSPSVKLRPKVSVHMQASFAGGKKK